MPRFENETGLQGGVSDSEKQTAAMRQVLDLQIEANGSPLAHALDSRKLLNLLFVGQNWKIEEEQN